MKITYHQVQDKLFGAALNKLATHGGFTNYKDVANIKNFLKQFEKISINAQKEWIELLKSVSQLDDKGQFVSREEVGRDGKSFKIPGTFIITPGKEEEFKAKEALFNAMEKDAWVDPVPFETVQGCGLSAVDLVQLEAFIIEPTEEKAQELKAV